MAKTHYKKLMNPNYLGAYSIEDGKDLVLTIQTVRQESVTGADGKHEDCVVCYFAENVKPMILNSTNLKMITKLLGTPYIEDWAGHKIQIGIEKVRAFGDIVEALRVRKNLPKTVVIKCEECGQPISDAYGMIAEDFAKYTKEKLGKSLCKACADKAASAKKEQTDGSDE